MDNIKKNWHLIIIGLIFILAFILRVKTYLLARPLWHDECSLATNIFTKNFLDLFKPLENGQKAPILFMALNKFTTNILGIKELSIKFIPFLSGILSIIAFYFLSKNLLKNNLSVLIANFLFAINYQLIYWSQKFKQYSFDVLIFIISILIFNKIDINKLNIRQCLIFSAVCLILILASFSSAFVFGAYILCCILHKKNTKNILYLSLPIIIIGLFYYIGLLRAEHKIWMSTYFKYWDLGFLKFNFSNILLILRENFNFFFIPNNFSLLGVLLFFWGLFLLIKNKTNNLIPAILLIMIIASFLQIYPIWQRASLFIIPLIILLICNTLNLISKNRKTVSTIIILLFLTYFSKYNFSYLNWFLKQNAFAYTDAVTIFPKLIEKYNNQDILVINSTTKADFVYYSTIYKFNPKKYALLPITQYDKKYYYSLLNSFPKKQIYWFLFGWEYSHRIDNPDNSLYEHLNTYINEHKLKIIEKYNDGNSILMKVQF